MASVNRGKLTGGTPFAVDTSVLNIEDTGAASLTRKVVCDRGDVMTIIPAPGTAHPDFTNLKARSYQILYIVAGMATIEVTYTGYATTLPDPVWSVRTTTGEESIRLNANFPDLKTQAEGETPSGYITDENGAFLEFTAPEEIAGVESYLAPKVILIKRYTTETFPTSRQAKVGFIDTPSGTGMPTGLTEGSENWLLAEFESEPLGDGSVHAISETWMKSGPNGWNVTIYTKPTV